MHNLLKEVSKSLMWVKSNDISSIDLANELIKKDLTHLCYISEDKKFIHAFSLDYNERDIIYPHAIDFSDATTKASGKQYYCHCQSHSSPCIHNIALLTYLSEHYESNLGKINKTLIGQDRQLQAHNFTREQFEKLITIFSPKKRQIDREIISKAQDYITFVLSVGFKNALNQEDESSNFDDFFKRFNAFNDYPENALFQVCKEIFYAFHSSEYEKAQKKLSRAFKLLNEINQYLDSLKLTVNPLPALNNNVESLLGHEWNNEELLALNLTEANVNLLQFCFWPHEQEFKYYAYWINLATGEIYRSSAPKDDKDLKSKLLNDSVSNKVSSHRIFKTPNNINPDIVLEEPVQSPLQPEDIAVCHQFAHTDFQTLAHEVISNFQSSLNNQHPIYFIKGKRCYLQDQSVVILDENNFPITLSNIPFFNCHPNMHDNMTLVQHLLPENISEYTLAIMFSMDENTEFLIAKPMAMFLDNEMLRLII
ncbi:hypothetical protein [Thorsellia kenyensis]|uniref:SWIM-type domain-containing protein n=1 Tax=Thorsellia kenyensis TaxID=1549888 RepID=A0ABV6C6G3_9GAMM